MDVNPTIDEVTKIEARFKELGKTYDFKMFPNARHGFNCDERASYHEESAKDAWGPHPWLVRKIFEDLIIHREPILPYITHLLL